MFLYDQKCGLDSFVDFTGTLPLRTLHFCHLNQNFNPR